MARLDKDAVKRANPLERVIPEMLGEHVLEVGGELKIRCPWHEDKRPSLRINVAEQKWYCDPCGKGGDVFAFVQKLNACDFPTALAWLAQRAGLDAPPPAAPPARRIVATYDYADEHGTLLYQTVRYDPKDFKQRRPDPATSNGQTGWIWKLEGVRRVLYRLPDLKGPAMVVCEGEKDVETLRAIGLPATCNVGGAGKWKDEYTQQLIAAGVQRVRIIPDQDEPGRAHADAIARSCLAAGLADVRIVTLPVTEKGADVSDYLGTRSKAELVALLNAAPVYTPSTQAPIPPIESDAATPAHRATKREKSDKAKQGRAVQFEDPEPWPDPVDGAALLDALATTFERYLALPDHASAALALWVLHAYTFAAWFTSPFLVITSPVKRCGKTQLLIVLGALVPRRLFASNVTPAVLFRTIEKYSPTLLIDEADTFVRENDELRGVLNSGHTRTTAVAIRTVGDDHEPRAFSTWCPKAIALIGKLPDTLADRAIEVAMRRRIAGERIERLRQDRIEAECQQVRRQAVRWAADHLTELQDANPIAPVELHDRAADCWRPLLALADRAGARWPAVAREAAQALSGVTDDDDQPAAVLLLGDVQTIFATRHELSSADLVKALQALESRPWATWGKDNKGLTSHALARLLKVFRVHPVKIRFGDDTANGYTRRMFEDAWTRYTPPSQLEHWNNFNNDGPETAFLLPEHPETCSSCENTVSINNDGLCSSVPVAEGGKADNAWLDL